MFSINNLSIHFGGHYLFDDVSMTISEKDRIGLIGRNGTGKSTLLKIIAGEISPETGNITKPNSFTIGYLPQEINTKSTKTVYEEAYSALSEIKSLESRIEELGNAIATRTDYESKEYNHLVTEFSDANERLRILGGHSIEANIEQILKGLGFKQEDFTKPLSTFSGGWQMRVELAKILLVSPDCILLDEPTNHLDIESIFWLEEFLKNFQGILLIISHDRRFLDHVTNRTIEISLGKVYDFPLPYTKFIEHRQKIKEQQYAAYNNQQKQIAQTERFIERFRSKANLATRVQSKVKQLEKIDRIEVEEEDYSKIKLSFPEAPRSGRLVVEANGLSKSYGDNNVLRNIDFAIERGEKVAFVGKNGEGKSTLSKIIAGMEDYEGNIKLGHNVTIGYYAQHQAQLLDENSTVFDIIDTAAKGDMRSQIRNLLGAFLFSGDSVYKKVKVLSGGERSRLSIARLLLDPFNLLLLDEPTNHLDMMAKDVLKRALLDYNGALIVVSHDREFLDGLTEKTFQFKNGKTIEHPGPISHFLEKQRLENLAELEYSRKEKKQVQSVQSDAKLSREKKKALQRDENRLHKQIETIMADIEKMESRTAELEEEFSSDGFFLDKERSQKLQKEYDELKVSIEQQMEIWTELESQMNEIQSQY